MIILACGMVREELEYAVKKLGLDLKVEYMDAALHIDLKKLKTDIDARLAELETTGDEIRLLYGNMCHPDLCAVCRQHGTGLPSVGINCIELVIPPKLAASLMAEAKTFFITTGWLAQWRNFFEKQGWDTYDARMNMGYYDRILLLDAGLREVTDEEIIEYFEMVQVPIDTYDITMDYFESRLLELINSPPASALK